MTFVTTLPNLANKAIDLYRVGMLGYQSPDNHKQSCKYVYHDGRRCAIGAGLPYNVALDCNFDGENDSSVDVLQLRGKLKIEGDFEVKVSGEIRGRVTGGWYDTPGTVPASSLLQFLHDSLCGMVGEFGVQERHLLSFLKAVASGEQPAEFSL